MILGYVLAGPDNDSFMHSTENRIHAETCPICGYLLNFDYHDRSFVLKKRIYDISHCYDVGDIVSNKFKEFCIRNEYANLDFLSFDNSKEYHQLLVRQKLILDTELRNVQFSEYCDHCNNFREIIGATPAFLKVESPIEDGFYRSHINFGSGNNKGPIILVGKKTKTRLERENLNGLDFEPVYEHKYWLAHIKPKAIESKPWYKFW